MKTFGSFICLFYSTLKLLGTEIEQKILICGVCKNVESQLPHTIEIIESIGHLFADYQVLIYENNSSDRTLDLLKLWAERNPHIAFNSENLTDMQLTISRTELIARARNIVLDLAFSQEYESFPYIAWIDMDFVIAPELTGIVEVFNSPSTWDGVFAYGVAPNNQYWDWYALRIKKYPFGPELLGNPWYQNWQGRESYLILDQKTDWIPVYSAFGGFGIYRKSSLKGCRYSGIVTQDLEDLTKKLLEQGTFISHPEALKYTHSRTALVWNTQEVCEHVPMHASMIQQGHDQLYIIPKIVFTYGTKKRDL